MIYISSKKSLQNNDLNTLKVIFCDVIGCSFGVCHCMILMNSIKIFYIPNAPS